MIIILIYFLWNAVTAQMSFHVHVVFYPHFFLFKELKEFSMSTGDTFCGLRGITLSKIMKHLKISTVLYQSFVRS